MSQMKTIFTALRLLRKLLEFSLLSDSDVETKATEQKKEVDCVLFFLRVRRTPTDI